MAVLAEDDRAHLGSSVAVVRGKGEGMVRVVPYSEGGGTPC